MLSIKSFSVLLCHSVSSCSDRPSSFRLCPLPLVTTEKILAYPLSTLLFRYLYRLVRSSLNLLSSRLDSPSSLYLSLHEPRQVQSLVCLCGPSLGSLQYAHVSVLGSPELDTALQVSPAEG